MSPGGWRGSSKSNRSEELPPDWPAIRERVMRRDGRRCVWRLPSGARCPNPATDVDHIDAPWDHRDENLRALCGPHHDKRTAKQGNAAKKRYKPPVRDFRKPPW